MNINLAHLSQFYLPDISQKKKKVRKQIPEQLETQLANATARLLASLKGHRDQENLFDWKKANDIATFKKAIKMTWGTKGWSASFQPPEKLQNKPLWKSFQAHEMPGDGKQPVSTNLPRIHSAWPSWLSSKRQWRDLAGGNSRCHSPWSQQGFQQRVP